MVVDDEHAGYHPTIVAQHSAGRIRVNPDGLPPKFSVGTDGGALQRDKNQCPEGEVIAMYDVVNLIARAIRGDESAWVAIVRRYSPLVRSTCRRNRISGADADDVEATVWMRLVTNLAAIRAPEALPGWLATTARRECHQLTRNQDRRVPFDEQQIAGRIEPDLDQWLLVEERRITLRDAVTRLPDRDRQLMSMLFSDPPVPYTQISARLSIPVGAIGPTRQRCLARIRRHPALAALFANEYRRHALNTVSA